MDATITNGYRRRILFKVIIRFIIAFIFIGILLFFPAGTLKYYNGWLFMAGLMIPMLFVMIYFYFTDPELLEKRINTKEKEDVQKAYIKLSIAFYVGVYIIPGLDFRYSWSDVPLWLVLVSLALMISGYVMFIFVLLQNRYASRVVEIQNEQKLIDTGLYSIVRHPMYLAASIIYIPSALVLGSYVALIPMLLLPLLLAFRIKNEEKVLLKGLPGYDEYMKKVRYRMVPFIW